MPDYNPYLEVDTGYAMTTSGGFSSLTFRSGFDISIPVFSPLVTPSTAPGQPVNVNRSWLVISSQPNFHGEFRDIITDLAVEHPSFLVLNNCISNPSDAQLRCRDEETFRFPDILQVITR